MLFDRGVTGSDASSWPVGPKRNEGASESAAISTVRTPDLARCSFRRRG